MIGFYLEQDNGPGRRWTGLRRRWWLPLLLLPLLLGILAGWLGNDRYGPVAGGELAAQCVPCQQVPVAAAMWPAATPTPTPEPTATVADTPAPTPTPWALAALTLAALFAPTPTPAPPTIVSVATPTEVAEPAPIPDANPAGHAPSTHGRVHGLAAGIGDLAQTAVADGSR